MKKKTGYMVFERYPGPKYEIKKVKYCRYSFFDDAFSIDIVGGSTIVDDICPYSTEEEAREFICNKAQKRIDKLNERLVAKNKELLAKIKQQEQELNKFIWLEDR